MDISKLIKRSNHTLCFSTSYKLWNSFLNSTDLVGNIGVNEKCWDMQRLLTGIDWSPGKRNDGHQWGIDNDNPLIGFDVEGTLLTVTISPIFRTEGYHNIVHYGLKPCNKIREKKGNIVVYYEHAPWLSNVYKRYNGGKELPLLNPDCKQVSNEYITIKYPRDYLALLKFRNCSGVYLDYDYFEEVPGFRDCSDLLYLLGNTPTLLDQLQQYNRRSQGNLMSLIRFMRDMGVLKLTTCNRSRITFKDGEVYSMKELKLKLGTNELGVIDWLSNNKHVASIGKVRTLVKLERELTWARYNMGRARWTMTRDLMTDNRKADKLVMDRLIEVARAGQGTVWKQENGDLIQVHTAPRSIEI